MGRSVHAIFSAFAVLVLAACSTTDTASTASDRGFATTAAQDSAAEIDMARMGLDKAQSPDVRAFARQMLDDHSANTTQLKRASQASGISIPNTPAADDQADARRLAALTGSDFDRAYMRAMVQEHREAVSMFENEARNGADPNIRSFAQQALPKLRQHLAQAEAVAGRL